MGRKRILTNSNMRRHFNHPEVCLNVSFLTLYLSFHRFYNRNKKTNETHTNNININDQFEKKKETKKQQKQNEYDSQMLKMY
jgi:hypothetical protein